MSVGTRCLPRIVYKDRYLLVLDKPSGWTVLYGSGKRSKLQNWLLSEGLLSPFNRRTGIVHRLDKDTSGLLLVARLPLSFRRLKEAFKAREVKKEYFALARGKLPATGVIRAPIGRSKGRRKFAVIPEGKKAITKYRREEIYRRKGEVFSLLEVFPLTGRTHQIRLHFKYLGFPLAGDPLYGFKKDRLNFPRLFLHAKEITFTHPFTQRTVSFKSSLPAELRAVLHD